MVFTPILLVFLYCLRKKAVILAFSSITNLFIRDIHTKFAIPNLPQFPDIRQNSDGDIFDYQISGQIPYKLKLSHNSRTSDIHMKLEPLTKLEKRNMATSKNIYNDVVLTNYDVIIILAIDG